MKRASNVFCVAIACAAMGYGAYMYDLNSKLEADNIELVFANENLAKALATRTQEPSAIIGIRNNNPMNVKGTGWVGQCGQDEHGHAIFVHHAYGLRAGARVLKTYYYKHGLKTIDAIIDRYCTGNKAEYKKFLAHRLGVGVTEEIDIRQHYAKLLQAMVHFETGEQPYPDHDYALIDVWRDTSNE